MPAGYWGWHQLDRTWAERLVRQTAVRPDELVLDIGAGTGIITAALLRAGARVIAVEAHPVRAARLRTRFGPRVTVVQADALDLRLPKQPFVVVANPPFGITTGLLRRLTSTPSRMDRATLVLPTYAVARWTAGRGIPSRFEHRHGGRVPARAFRPPPPTDAAVLVIGRSTRNGAAQSRSYTAT